MAGANATCCPSCGAPMPAVGMERGFAFGPGYPAGFGPAYGFPPIPGWWVEAYPTWAYVPGGFAGPGVPTDEEITQMIYDSIDADAAVPYDSDVNVDVTGGVVTLTGTVPNKRIKHNVGDDAWWVPGVWDISNNLQIARRVRRSETAGEKRPNLRS